jgi:hypothetical protein
MRRILTLAIWSSLFISAGAWAFDPPSFPRLAADWTSNQNYQDPAIQSQLARGSIAIIGVWPGWESGRGTTVQQVIKNIKAINPNTLVFNYISNNEIPADRSAYPAWAPLYSKLDSMGWFLYANGGCCAQVNSTWPGAVILNNTLFAPPDANGDRWVDWYAKWVVNQYYVPNPSFDGFFTDNVFWKPAVDGDWNRDGSTDSASNPTVQTWFRQGYAHHFTLLKSLMPGKFQIGNVAEWGDPSSVITEYQGVLNGGMIEQIMGESYSVETWGGWQAMMAWYRKTMNALGAPKLGIFHQVGIATDYQGMRYGLASALMDDGYYMFNTEAAQDGDAPWFDEYQAVLGTATSAPATTAWQNGVYRRDFANGIALVNPKGNGAQTITLEGDFKRLSGTQAPTVNSGQTVRTLTLQDRDGIILMRLTSIKVPQAPSGLKLQN